MKKVKITDSMQKTAAAVLSHFEFCNNMDDVVKAFNNVVEIYGLMKDPFTNTVCTPKQYEKSAEEYNRQMMEEKFDYYD